MQWPRRHCLEHIKDCIGSNCMGNEGTDGHSSKDSPLY